MLIATWIITFVLIIGVGIYAGTKITQSNQWSGSDHSMGIVSIGCMLGAWQMLHRTATPWALPACGIL